MHVPFSLLWNTIPENVKQAFDHCKWLVVELDLTDKIIKQACHQGSLLPNSRTLSQEIESILYDR